MFVFEGICNYCVHQLVVNTVFSFFFFTGQCKTIWTLFCPSLKVYWCRAAGSRFNMNVWESKVTKVQPKLVPLKAPLAWVWRSWWGDCTSTRNTSCFLQSARNLHWTRCRHLSWKDTSDCYTHGKRGRRRTHWTAGRFRVIRSIATSATCGTITSGDLKWELTCSPDSHSRGRPYCSD